MSSESDTGGTGRLCPEKLGIGMLRNGDPRGDANPGACCGAKSRKPGGCPCRAPAMANGRCRAHGGLSTGPRTEEGRARVRAARTKHGCYSAESKAAWRRLNAFMAESRAMLAQVKAGTFRLEPTVAPRPRLCLVGGVEWERRQAQAVGKTLYT